MSSNNPNYMHEYYLKNKLKLNEQTAKWHEAHKEEMKAYQKAYQKLYRERKKHEQTISNATNQSNYNPRRVVRKTLTPVD